MQNGGGRGGLFPIPRVRLFAVNWEGGVNKRILSSLAILATRVAVKL